MNTNIDGRIKIPFALTSIKGVGRRFAYVCLRKADVDPNKRAGELSEEEVRESNILKNVFKFLIVILNRLTELSQLCLIHVITKSQTGS